MTEGIAYIRRLAAKFCLCGIFLWLLMASRPVYSAPGACGKLTIEGEVAAGHEWSAPLGLGWVFRVIPIQPADKYSGWDLVVDREEPVGFPDALLLATPPYGSLNEREVGTTYGLRAQDAIGWNPRSFRFLTDETTLQQAQQAYRTLPPGAQADGGATARLLSLIGSASNGEFRILDARLTPGVADPAPYAQSWALAASRTPHEVVPASQGTGTARGSLAWMRFSVTLWPPAGWHAPRQWVVTATPCRR
jgi:hypothetical protein